nr:hypothetical protein [uncultured Methanoregula sp.]
MKGESGSGRNLSMPPPGQPAALLSCLLSARDRLARNLVRDVHAVTDPDLNFIPVSALFQILFLKTGQESGFAEPGTLAALAGSDGIADRMARACSDAGLFGSFFEQGPGTSRTLPPLPDEPLRAIIREMDEPNVPVPLAGLALEELAAVLEQFLGTRMQAAEGCRVDRAGKSALLYTGTLDVPPLAIVEPVVRGSLNPEARDAGVERVLDPACGCGIFLLSAYRNSARRNTRPYDSQNPRKHLPGRAVASVFGTDIDPESVSAARFVLLLAFMEEQRHSGCGPVSPETLREVCACLTETIRCGNSLIGPDYFSQKPVFPFNADERRKVNPFSWQETFPEILAGGGFDAVVGAPPPYRPFAVPAREEYFQTHYDIYAPLAGLYGYFIEKGLRLLRPGAILTFLLPGTFLRSRSARPLRRLLLSRQIERIACTGRTRVLPEGEVMMYSLTIRNQPPERPFVVSPGGTGSGELSSGQHDFLFDQRLLDDGSWKLEDTRTVRILEKIQATGTALSHYILDEFEAGVHPVRDNPLVVDQETRTRLTRRAWWARRFFVPLLRPADIRRHVPAKPSRYVILVQNSRDIRRCRALSEYLEQAAALPKPDSARELPGDWKEQFPDPAETRFPEHMRPKIIFSLYQHSPAFSFDPDGTYALTISLAAIPRNDPYLAAILNSSLGRFVVARICPLTDRGYHVSTGALGKFPVMVPDFDKLADRTRHDKIVALVSQLISLHHYLPRAKTDQERRLVQQEIDVTDVRINALVYELYGLSPEEIAVVEENLSS